MPAVTTLLTLVACTEIEAETAPPTLESQSLVAVQRFYDDDAAEQIATLIDLVNEEVSDEPHGFYFGALTPEDVSMYAHSDEAIWEHTTGCGVLAKVRGTVDQYAAIVPEPDQSFPDPSYAVWTREITGGTAEDFTAGGPLDTWNHVEKSGFGFDVAYDMDKDYRWYGDTLAMVSIVPDGKLPVDEFDTQLVVGWTIELWYTLDDTLIWYNASWTEIESPLDEDNVDIEWWLDQLIAGTLDYYWGTEEHATGIPHEEPDEDTGG
jgi:hypothetical protein